MGNKKNKRTYRKLKPKAYRKLAIEKCASMRTKKAMDSCQTIDNSDAIFNSPNEQENIQHEILQNIVPDIQVPPTLPVTENVSLCDREITQSATVSNALLEMPGSSINSQKRENACDQNNGEDTLFDEVMYNYEDEKRVACRRIIDVNYFLCQLQEKARHNELFECKEGYFKIIGERRFGLISKFKLQCNMCQEIVTVSSENVGEIEEKKSLNLNVAATTGIIATGIGHSQFEELFSAIDIPVFSTNTYLKLQNEVYEYWEITAADAMQATVDKEKEIAISEGHTKDGYPVIDVYADGAWSARSYGTNFKALSGAAAIIGRRSGEVLYMGVKNKYCLICSRANFEFDDF